MDGWTNKGMNDGKKLMAQFLAEENKLFTKGLFILVCITQYTIPSEHTENTRHAKG